MLTSTDRLKVAVICLPFWLVSIANGLYTERLSSKPLVFWSLDALVWCILAPVLVWIIRLQAPTDAAAILGFGKDGVSSKKIILITLACAFLLPFVCLGFIQIPLGFLIPIPEIQTPFVISHLVPSGMYGVLVSAYLALTAGIFEEIFYRAIPYALITHYSQLEILKTTYVVSSSILFSAVHWEQGSNVMGSSLVIGVIFSLVYLRIRRIEPLIAGHVVIDLCLFLR